MKAKDKILKLISAFLIISFVVPSVLLYKPKVADAQWYTFSISDFWNGLTSGFSGTTATTNSAKLGLAVKDAAKEILKQAAMTVAKKALQEVTKSTVNWINAGFHGSPLFLENPDSFFEDIAKSELKNLVDMFGYDALKYPFGKEFALSTINAYKSKLEDNTAYTLSKVMTDRVQIRNYQNDFNVGGWNGFIVNTQFPQNNPLGFQMEATEELARRIQGTGQAAAEKIQTTLDQGMGFLSPEKCPDDINPEYNKVMANAWKRPAFDRSSFENDYNPPDCDGSDADHTINSEGTCTVESKYNAEWQAGIDAAQTEWAKKNECVKPNGKSALVNTTPGSVVADQIKINLGSGVHQKELAAAMGNSLSAVFDALLNKFIGDGLNSLATTINPPPETEDNWNYEGLTLGTEEEGGTNATWDVAPDVVIDLDAFKKQLSGKTIVTTTGANGAVTATEEIGNTRNCTYVLSKWVCPSAAHVYVPGDIANTQKELQLMDDLTYTFSQIWPETRKLDMCVPGPDINWQDRLQAEVLRNSQKLQKIQGEDNAKKSEEANAALKELKFAVDFFKDWINNKMMTELPNSIFYMEAVDDVKTLPQQATELIDAKRLKTQALARLQAIKTALDTLTTAPPGSAQEKTLILIKKQYDGIRPAVSSSATLSARQNDLDVAEDKFANLKKLLPQCETERKAKGWGTPGGATSSFSGSSVITQTPGSQSPIGSLAVNSEQAIFCSLPIIGGYSHEKFLNQTGTTHPEIPMVNAKKILRYEITTIKSFLTSLPGNHTTAAYVNIQLSCNAIFNAKLLDYKGSLPGLTTVREITDTLPDDSGVGETGTCTYPVGDDGIVPIPTEDISKEDCDLNEGTWTANEE
ncbi:MAG: hypothetical protein WAV15_02405 [Minisyncoccia bacterium]